MFNRKFFLIALPVVFLILSFFVLLQTRRRVVQGECCGVLDFSGKMDLDQKLAVYHGKTVNLPADIFKENQLFVLGVSDEERWIEVDLSEQKIKAWEGSNLFLESLVSTGLPWWPTPKGEFKIWSKARATKMEGGEGKYYYYLPNVPYVMFFENDEVPGYRGFSLHGTYWHNDFGRVHSHGCVNLPTPVAQRLYSWTLPAAPAGKSYVRAVAENPGTRIVIHD